MKKQSLTFLAYLIGAVILILAHERENLAQPATPSWSFTGSLNQPRFDHTATLLAGGKVLVVGGVANGITGTAELYDPVTATWTITGSLNIRRDKHTATLLNNGKVLVTGGFTDAPGPVGTPALPATNTAELYDPSTGIWSATSNMNSRRASHSATLLPNGKVLVVGGLTETGYVGFSTPLNTAELYDPQTGTWSFTGSLKTGRGHVVHTATLLQKRQGVSRRRK